LDGIGYGVVSVDGFLDFEVTAFERLSLLKTSYRPEFLVFPPNAGYLLRHANDRLSPPRHSP
jgi:hypothetical protein